MNYLGKASNKDAIFNQVKVIISSYAGRPGEYNFK
jgi:hypothetical protein